MVRNSAVLETLVEIVRGPQGSLLAVEMAGRGIAAEARCSLAILADKELGLQSSGPVPEAVQRALVFADHLIELGEVADSLEELWRLRSTGETDDASFEAKLGHLVRCLEEWPDKALRPFHNGR
jgi:hypothetical protein